MSFIKKRMVDFCTREIELYNSSPRYFSHTFYIVRTPSRTFAHSIAQDFNGMLALLVSIM